MTFPGESHSSVRSPVDDMCWHRPQHPSTVPAYGAESSHYHPPPRLQKAFPLPLGRGVRRRRQMTAPGMSSCHDYRPLSSTARRLGIRFHTLLRLRIAVKPPLFQPMGHTRLRSLGSRSERQPEGWTAPKVPNHTAASWSKITRDLGFIINLWLDFGASETASKLSMSLCVHAHLAKITIRNREEMGIVVVVRQYNAVRK